MRHPKTMTDYLNSLEQALLWRRGRQECMEILEDYESFFRAGLADGRTEEEICQDLGAPAALVQAIAEEPRNMKYRIAALRPTAAVRLLAGALLTGVMLLLLLFCWKDWWRFFNAFPIRPDILGTLLIPCCLTLLLWSGLPTLWHPKHTGRLLALCHLGTVLILAVAVGLLLWATYAYIFEYPIFRFLGEDLHRIGPRLSAILNIAVALSACIFCVALWGMLRRSVWLMTAVAHSMGALFALMWLCNMLVTLDSTSTFWPNLFYAMHTYPAGLVGALAVGVLLLLGKRWRMHRCVDKRP